MMYAAVLAFGRRALDLARRVPGLLPLKVWIVAGVLILFLGYGAYSAQKAVEGERARQAAEQAKTERTASTARETAAAERLSAALSNNAAREELNDALKDLPDAVPSDRRVRLACVRLSRQGTPANDLPERCRSDG